MLEVKDISVSYGVTPVLHGVSINIDANEMIAILGTNGAGKSTLVNTILGMVKSTDGTITFEGQRIDKLPPHEIIHRGIAQVPEARRIFPYLTVMDNLMVGAYNKNAWSIRKKNLERVFNLFPILKERKNQTGGTLSGGEQQMMVIGRGLMSNPKLLMVDEPSLGLAPKILEVVYDILSKFRDEKITTILSEQNARQALSISDRGYIMENGRVILTDKSENLLDNDKVKKAYLGI
ncbi:MAG: ABC transporter ATP-binding protein [Dehalococcoidia bacterium]|nr:ABC transporter ATP-binding protein [Dehalococcoidia bacterium]MDD5493515.1 ABC transporter ATP-binding protein [Dehalococcoidia bacterium]